MVSAFSVFLRMRSQSHAEDDLSVLLWKADRHVSCATSSSDGRRHGGHNSSQGTENTGLFMSAQN